MTDNNKFEQWVRDNLSESVYDIVNHGVNCGFPGITTYHQTGELYAEFKEDIINILADEAEAMGENLLTLLSQGNMADSVSEVHTFENYVVWFAVEIIAHRIYEEQEEGANA